MNDDFPGIPRPPKATVRVAAPLVAVVAVTKTYSCEYVLDCNATIVGNEERLSCAASAMAIDRSVELIPAVVVVLVPVAAWVRKETVPVAGVFHVGGVVLSYPLAVRKAGCNLRIVSVLSSILPRADLP